jgi:hypothetical protein
MHILLADAIAESTFSPDRRDRLRDDGRFARSNLPHEHRHG